MIKFIGFFLFNVLLYICISIHNNKTINEEPVSKFEKMEFDIYIKDASGELVWSTTYCEDQKLYNEFKSKF